METKRTATKPKRKLKKKRTVSYVSNGLPTPLYTALKTLADRNNRNVSNQIRQCIIEIVEKEGIKIKST